MQVTWSLFKQHKKTVILMLCIVAVIGLSFVGFGIYHGAKVKKLGESRLEKRERSFRSNPNLIDGLVLLETFYELKDYNRAIFYGRYCVNLDSDKTKRGYYVRVLLAKMYFDANNKTQACSEIKIAMSLARRDKLRENSLEGLEFRKIIDGCKEQ